MSKHHSCFDFLKEGHDKQFDSAMNSIDSMYDNLFNSDKLDKMFENLKYQNNPITQPIDEMTKEIFNTQQASSGPKYIKTQDKKTSGQIEDFVVGQPLYQNSNIDNYYSPNPYANIMNSQQSMNKNSIKNNPYYQTADSNNNYFGTWSESNKGNKNYYK